MEAFHYGFLIWLHLLKKSLMENFRFYAMNQRGTLPEVYLGASQTSMMERFCENS